MSLFYSDDWLTVHQGDCREVMASMEPESVDCVVTSPPYYSLRDYGLEPVVWDGELEHDHEWGEAIPADSRHRYTVEGSGPKQSYVLGDAQPKDQGAFCPCGAWRGQLGLEPDPLMFVDHMVEVFRLARRVMRRDGTLWLNLGDSYAAKGARRMEVQPSKKGPQPAKNGPSNGRVIGFKEKDRMMIPARVAIALQADGWWLRDEIVWAKPNPMPSSVEDRTTPAHEMVYLLTKSARYEYDAAAIREVGDHHRNVDRSGAASNDLAAVPPGASNHRGLHRVKVPGGWDIGPGAHGTRHRTGRTSATYVEGKQAAAAAATPSGSASSRTMDGLNARWDAAEEAGNAPLGRNKRSVWTVATEPYPDAHFATFPEKLIEPMILAGTPPGGVVLDPFGGSGTVAVVAQRLGRRAVLIDLNADYLVQAMRRNQDIPLGLETA